MPTLHVLLLLRVDEVPHLEMHISRRSGRPSIKASEIHRSPYHRELDNYKTTSSSWTYFGQLKTATYSRNEPLWQVWSGHEVTVIACVIIT